MKCPRLQFLRFAAMSSVATIALAGTAASAQQPSAPPQAQAQQPPQTQPTKPSVPSLFGPPQPHTDAPPEAVKRYPGDGNGAYHTGKYRDLFAERGHTAAESRAKIDAGLPATVPRRQRHPGDLLRGRAATRTVR